MTGSLRCCAWRTALVFGLALASTPFGARPAAAVENETFGLVPHPEKVDGSPRRTFGVPLEPGAVFEDAIRVYNRTNQELDLLVYAADAETGTDGTISVGFRGSRPNGVGGWISLSGDELKLPPRGEALMQFRIEVRSADPAPDLGAIAVEASEPGVAANLAERLHLVVRTTSPNSPTTSVRVRPLLLRSPWIIVAILGLIVALTIVWLGARRARRPKDAVVPSGHLEERSTEPEVTPAASKPVLRRLGESPSRKRGATESRFPRAPRARGPSRRQPEPADEYDGRPMLDEGLADLDEAEGEAPTRAPAKARASRGKPAARKSKQPSRKQEPGKKAGRFIPLDDL
ncbi:MAG: hypothetical protein ACRDKJ_11615 [Actinomycetota bacterium]